jgi:serine/threonine-protein kinase
MEQDAASDPGVKPGEILAGKYQVERILGVGGMGVVVAAHHIQLDEKVALKFLLPDALKNTEALARFEREARAAVKIKSEHIARVIDVGKLDNGSPYMVMEYLEGGDLSGMLAKTGKLPVEQAVDFVLQASEAIAEAHALGIVHRDLKPANLFCIRRRDGQLAIKVLDFGISKVTKTGSMPDSMSMTKTTAVIGSPVYMSPEQMQSSKGVDLRTDIWSMGVILYELVTGRLPFNGDTVTELAIRIATEPAPPMADIPPGLPAGLEPVVMRCLEKPRERRYQDMSELAVALLPFGSPRARHLVEKICAIVGNPSPDASAPLPASPMASTSATKGHATDAGWQSEPTGKKGSKAVLGIAAAVGLAVAVGGVVLFMRKGPAPEAPVVATTPATTSAAPSSPLPSAVTLTPPPDTASAAVAVAAVTSAPAAPTPPPATPAPRPATPSRPVAPAAPATPKTSCNPPYYFDAQGNRVFKKECL